MDDLVCFIGQKAFIEKDGELLLLRDRQTQGNDLPGGKIIIGETDLAASLQREVTEETGLDIEVGIPFFTWFYTIPLNSGHRSAGKTIFNVGYKCLYVNGIITLSMEHDKYTWINQSHYTDYRESGFFNALKAYFDHK